MRRPVPIHLLEDVVQEVDSPTALMNLACTSFTVGSIINSSPTQVYVADVRYHLQRSKDPEFDKETTPTLPSLIHAIRHEGIDKIKYILEIFQTQLSRKLTDVWDYEFPTPIEAAITAHRLDVFELLVDSGCGLTVRDPKGILLSIQNAYDRFCVDNAGEDNADYDSSTDPPHRCAVQDKWETENRHEQDGAYILACAEKQESMAIYLMDNVHHPGKFYMWVAVHAELERLSLRLTDDRDHTGRFGVMSYRDYTGQVVHRWGSYCRHHWSHHYHPLVDALNLLVFRFALSINSQYLASRVASSLGNISLDSETIILTAEKGYWDATFELLKNMKMSDYTLIVDLLEKIAPLAAATDDAFNVIKLISEDINDSLGGQPRDWLDLEYGGIGFQEKYCRKLATLSEDDRRLVKLGETVFEITLKNRHQCPRNFRHMIYLGTVPARKYLLDLVNMNDSKSLHEALPFHEDHSYIWAICSRGDMRTTQDEDPRYDPRYVGDKALSYIQRTKYLMKLLPWAIERENWECAFVLLRYDLRNVLMNPSCRLENMLLKRLIWSEDAEGKRQGIGELCQLLSEPEKSCPEWERWSLDKWEEWPRDEPQLRVAQQATFYRMYLGERRTRNRALEWIQRRNNFIQEDDWTVGRASKHTKKSRRKAKQ